MKLITKQIDKIIPDLYETENIKECDKILYIKLFCPWGSATWYISEYNKEEGICFGYCTGLYEDEWGYISLEELQAIRGPGGLKIERDRFFQPITFKELLTKEYR